MYPAGLNMALDHNGDNSSGASSADEFGVNFEKLVSLSNEAILQLSLDGKILFVSPAAVRLFGWGKDKLSEHLSDLVYLGPPNPEADQLHKILAGSAGPGAQLPHSEVQLRSAFGTLVWAEATTHLLQDGAGAPSAYVVFFRNIARRKELESLLEEATQTDPLTGLYNRRAFEDTLKREWAVALREKTHITLIKVSLDKYDALVEQLGPSAGEDCLSKVARMLKDTARRPADVAARTAMSEFALLLPRTHEMGAETISAFIQVSVQDLAIPNPSNVAGNGMITASVGAACSVADEKGVSESPEFLIAAAETCVFQARQEGGNRVKTAVNVLG